MANPSLDPTDWHAARALAHRMLDDIMGFLETVRERPVWQPVPAEVRGRFRAPLPEQPQGAERAYEDFRSDVLPYPTGNVHPRFWGWVIGTGTPLGMLAEMLAAGMNPNVFCGDQSPVYVEVQVLEWLKEMLGVDPNWSGLLVSGCSVANLVCLAAARDARAGLDVTGLGLAHAPQPPVLYCSVETHSVVDRAARVLGLGAAAVRRLPAPGYALDVDALVEAVRSDRERGLRPFCVVANAGTVNTGAFDDIGRIADIASREGLWVHVEGAFGVLAALTEEYRPRLSALARADSIAFDLHKWMHMPYAVGCALVRAYDALRGAFANHVQSSGASYLGFREERGLTAGPHAFADLGVELSRPFRALPLWLSLKAHGRAQFARSIEANIAQARYLAGLIESQPCLEVVAPVTLNVVCFRALARGQSGDELDAINRELLLTLQERGVVLPSATRLNGRYVLRVAITNHRTRREDLDALVSEVAALAEALLHSRSDDSGRASATK